MHPEKYLQITEEVSQAIREGRPVVALESTLIAHGMPFPQNKDTALQLESVIRAAGAVPATIALLNGKICVGLSEKDIHLLATSPEILKASKRDLSFILSQQLDAATTVATTMYCAHLAGIPFFATGGIGGVHRGGAQSLDISADLQELAQTRVVVVSAGAKSILDLSLTLEYLETMGVPVIGFQTNEFPAFYSRSSGIRLTQSLEDVASLARLVKTHVDLGLDSGILVANPIPPTHEIPAREVESWIEKAISLATQDAIAGKALSPFLLSKIKELSGGRSLEANIQLVLHNAKIAAELAMAYSK